LRYLHIAKGSAGEIRSQVHRAYNRKHFSKETHSEFIIKCKILSEKIYNFISYIQKSNLSGIKFKHREKPNIKIEPEN
jgi:four helix bundle protein